MKVHVGGGVGYPDFSMLLWFDWNEQNPEAYVSSGTVAATDFNGYNHGGTWTEYDAGYAVPFDVALRAAREFSETEARPREVAW
jgi:hypothetical protein